jgi:hypothetical protein
MKTPPAKNIRIVFLFYCSPLTAKKMPKIIINKNGRLNH